MLEQQLLNGLTLGSTYALVALGFTLVFGILGMINFAHGEIFMLGAYIEATHAVEQESILSAFAERGIKPGMLKSNREAIEMGRRIVSSE